MSRSDAFACLVVVFLVSACSSGSCPTDQGRDSDDVCREHPIDDATHQNPYTGGPYGSHSQEDQDSPSDSATGSAAKNQTVRVAPDTSDELGVSGIIE